MVRMKVRCKYRLRPGRQAERYLLAEWDACRYVWNRMVDESQARHERGETFGAAQAQKYLTFLRASKTDKDGGKWLAAHSCVPQQQIVRDYSQSRGKAVSDRKTSSRKRKTGMPRHKSRKTALPSLNYRIGGFNLVEQDGKPRLKLPKGMIIPVVWSRELPSQPKSVRVYEINGPMFFGMTDRISDISVKDFTKYLIIRMRGVPSLDATGMNALENLYEYCAENGVQLIFSHANEQPMRTMRRAGFVDLVGEERFRPNIDDAIAYARTQLEQEEKAA